MDAVDNTKTNDRLSFDGRVMGAFENKAELNAFVQSLGETRSGDIEIYEGAAGLESLKKTRESVGGFLDRMLGDLESSMSNVYTQAIEQGWSVFAVEAEGETKDRIVRTAQQQGARHLVHFGTLVNESYDLMTGDHPA
jgi:hypothetical protein